ncbi:sugar isomerase domain-containing protein [Streptomyces montanisoli]|uniref:SIS domain-containing protein n=1 Tax=Streptomyces montanisoli TaxID=2798581 RepID=A0A940M6Y5_9ACTN|nr:SIS domain-containing protein [Streptomyces montanisoli]MBP0457319.1 SIS domain-containing protein [Streptomyces montanisoli]
MPDSQEFLAAAGAVVDRVVATHTEAVASAAELIAKALRGDGVVQAFGTGHSESLATEIAGRAGGLVPTNKIALRDLVLHGGAPHELLADPTLERDPSIAHRLYELTAPHPEDVFVIASNSGINGCVVEMARIVAERGHPLIALTSLEHTARVDSRHPSGKRLTDFADVVLDNGAPFGDALLPLPGGGAACAVSSITAAYLAQMINAEVVRLLTDAGVTPPVYLSANVPGGDEHNQALEDRYKGRIRRTA